MRAQFIYYPSQGSDHVKTLLLDANITSVLDTIARRGSYYHDESIRQRIKDLVRRLDKNVIILPGLGAVESVMRRDGKITEEHNYFERGTNATRLLTDNRQALTDWAEARDPQINSGSHNFQKAITNFEKIFPIIYENMMLPSYAVILKAYKLYLSVNNAERNAVSALNELELFADELYGRGSRELFFGSLLLTGTPKAKQLALNIMKLQTENQSDETLKKLWNTSFDLTYSRTVEKSSLPEMVHEMPKPAVFVTDDEKLGELLKLITPRGGFLRPRNSVITGSTINMQNLIDNDKVDKVCAILVRSSIKAQNESTDVTTIEHIRKYRAKCYVKSLEDWFKNEYSN